MDGKGTLVNAPLSANCGHGWHRPPATAEALESGGAAANVQAKAIATDGECSDKRQGAAAAMVRGSHAHAVRRT